MRQGITSVSSCLLISASGLTGGGAEIQVELKLSNSLPSKAAAQQDQSSPLESYQFPVIDDWDACTRSQDDQENSNVESRVNNAQCIGLFFGNGGNAKYVHFIATTYSHVVQQA